MFVFLQVFNDQWIYLLIKPLIAAPIRWKIHWERLADAKTFRTVSVD